MTTKFVRCRHCQVQYAYHPSGDMSHLNNDTYCPECYAVILKALKDVPAKKRSVWVAAAQMSPVTIEDFNKARDAMILKGFHLVYSDNITVQSCPNIKGDYYRLCINKDDNSQLLEIECEEDVATGVITGTWNRAGFCTLHKSEEGRALSKEFWSKSHTRKRTFNWDKLDPEDLKKLTELDVEAELIKAAQKEVWPMSPSDDKVYYLKPIYKSSGDAALDLPDEIKAEPDV